MKLVLFEFGKFPIFERQMHKSDHARQVIIVFESDFVFDEELKIN